ncbi:MAG: AAA family ATPase [Candidatus Coatesbacteria bacterium]|nr:AAA family ATPase [Candidatus Coatesbacteria bacterium]
MDKKMKPAKNYKSLSPEKLRWKCPSDIFKKSKPSTPQGSIFGQDRALEAIRYGLGMPHFGYNIFVTGLTGTGRTTTIKRMLEEIKPLNKDLVDIAYVYNFSDIDKPLVLYFQKGKAQVFKERMNHLIEALTQKIPAIFEDDSFKNKRNSIVEKLQEKQRQIFKVFEQNVNKAGFQTIQVKMGPYTRPDVAPIIDEKIISMEDLEAVLEEKKITKEEYEKYKREYKELEKQMEIAFKKNRAIELELRDKLNKLTSETLNRPIKFLVDEVREGFTDKKILNFLKMVEQNISREPNRFAAAKEERNPDGSPKPPDPFLEYQVNIIVDNSEVTGTPIIIETNPSYQTVFGSIERVMDRNGVWRTDFTKITSGSLLAANGGYFVINAFDLLVEPGVWPTLKRTLRNEQVEMQTYDPFYLLTTSSIKPEPVKLDIKVVIIGDIYIYELLYDNDPEFRKIFKVRADFDTVMPRTRKEMNSYITFTKNLCKEENLLPFSSEAIGAVMEYGAMLAGDQEKLTARFSKISDLIRSANYWAKQEKSKRVYARHIVKASKEQEYRLNTWQVRYESMIEKGIIMIDTKGEEIGQLNGLAVYDFGEYSFGLPTRITATTSMGKSGIVNIEREAGMSGRTHTKGVLVLTGYLQSLFAQDKPIAMNASLCFEQSYSGIDGDSASSTEIYCLLSSLSEIPLKQNIAVTGSINQKGEIQAIGGVNQKIEGFFRICKARGLNGKHGVIIPRSNLKELMLNDEIIESVKSQKFSIFAIDRVEEGIEILTGYKAGFRLENKRFEEGTVFEAVDKKLREFLDLWKEEAEERITKKKTEVSRKTAKSGKKED